MNNPKNQIEVTINIAIRQPPGYGGGQIEIRENITMCSMGFLEMAAVLAKFHELAESLKKEQARRQ